MAGLATMAVVQAGTSIMSKVLNQGDYNNKDLSNKFVSNIIYPSNKDINNDILNNYPLNILEDVNLLLYAA